MIKVEPITNWKYIFLDTSVIIDLLQNPEKFKESNPQHYHRIVDTQNLFKYFQRAKEGKGKNYVFYISAISVAELCGPSEKKLFDKLLSIFSSGDLTFVDFTKENAFNISRNIREYVPEYQHHQLINYIEKMREKDRAFYNVRNWVINDLKLASTARDLNNLDVVLTGDKRTFVPICEKLQVPCVVTSEFPKDLLGEISTEIGF